MVDVTPADYGSILRSGASLVPDYAEQALRQSLAATQHMNAQANVDQEARLLAGQQREVERQGGFQAGLDQWLQDPTMDGISRLVGAYPEFHEQARRVYELRDEEARSTDRRQLAEAFGAIANGRPDLAIETIRARRAADLAAGGDTSDEDALLQMLESEDPEQHRRVRGLIAYELAGQMGEEHFASALDRLSETLELPDFEEYARSLGLEAGTDEYRNAMRDYVLRGSGPTAHGYDVELEGVRQEGREDLQAARERDRRNRPAAPRPTNVLERIRQKIAAGQQLTPGEQRLWTESQARRGQRGRAGGSRDGAIIRNPTTGQRMTLRNGQWVPIP